MVQKWDSESQVSKLSDDVLDKIKHMDDPKISPDHQIATMKDGLTVSVEHGETVIRNQGKLVKADDYAQEKHLGGKQVYELPNGVQMIKDGDATTVIDKKNGTEVITDKNGVVATFQKGENGSMSVGLPDGQSVRLPSGEIVSSEGHISGHCQAVAPFPIPGTERTIELPNGMKVRMSTGFRDDGSSSGAENILTLSTKDGKSVELEALFDRPKLAGSVSQEFQKLTLENQPPSSQFFDAKPNFGEERQTVQIADNSADNVRQVRTPLEGGVSSTELRAVADQDGVCPFGEQISGGVSDSKTQSTSYFVATIGFETMGRYGLHDDCLNINIGDQMKIDGKLVTDGQPHHAILPINVQGDGHFHWIDATVQYSNGRMHVVINALSAETVKPSPGSQSWNPINKDLTLAHKPKPQYVSADPYFAPYKPKNERPVDQDVSKDSVIFNMIKFQEKDYNQ